MGRIPPVRGWASGLGLLAPAARRPLTAADAVTLAAVGEVFARYGIAHDEGDIAALKELFTPNAVVEVSLGGPPFQRIQGLAAILANFAAVLRTQEDQRRHCITNLVVTPQEGGVLAQAYGLVSAAAGTELHLAAACAYAARLECGTDGLWRFARLWIGMDNYSGQAPGAR